MNTTIPIEIIRGLQVTLIALQVIPIATDDPRYQSKLNALQELGKLQDAIVVHFKRGREQGNEQQEV